MKAGPPVLPPLSALQRAYRSDPAGYLDSLRGRADRLFEQGYRADAAAIPCVFVVSHGARGADPRDPRDGAARYLVHAVKGTCDCPFFTRQRAEPLTADGSVVPCKHLLGLAKLVRLSADAYRAAGEMHRHFRLRSHWLGVLAERCRGDGATMTPPPEAAHAPFPAQQPAQQPARPVPTKGTYRR